MGVNNFKKLEELELRNISLKTDLVKKNLASNIGVLRFVTDILELYFPKLVELFVGMTGAGPEAPNTDTDERPGRYPDLK